jgi:hypothetical protein
MTGQRPQRTVSKKNVNRQIAREQHDLEEMLNDGACVMESGPSEGVETKDRPTKKRKHDEQEGGSSSSSATAATDEQDGNRTKKEAAMAKRDWEN